jgi:glutathione reductase (NADPH)
VRTHVHEEAEAQGREGHLQRVARSYREGGREVPVHLSNGESAAGDKVLFAVGRNPHTEGLGLEKAGVKLDEHGAVVVDDSSRTSVANIFAIGDVTNRLNLTPVAIREGRRAERVLDRPTSFDHADVPHAVFAQPPVGVVGLSEAEARKKYGVVDVYKTKFRPMKDMLTGDEERVLMKIVVRAEDERVVGVHIVGPDAPEIIQAVAIAVKMGATKADSPYLRASSIAEELVTMREVCPARQAGLMRGDRAMQLRWDENLRLEIPELFDRRDGPDRGPWRLVHTQQMGRQNRAR